MDASAFSENLARALDVCRSAAAQELPIAEMVEYVEDGIEAAMSSGLSQCGTAVEMLTMEPPRAVVELEALRVILSAVGDVAAIGTKLPPVAAHIPDAPLPANLRGA